FIIFAYIGGLLLLYPMEYLLFYSILLFFGIIGIMAAVKGNLPDIVFIPIWALIIVYSISGLLSPPPLDMGIIDELSIYTMGGFGGYYTFISFLLLIGNYYFEKYPEWNSKGDHTGIILLHYCNPIKDITFAGFWTLIIGISNRIPGLLKTEP